MAFCGMVHLELLVRAVEPSTFSPALGNGRCFSIGPVAVAVARAGLVVSTDCKPLVSEACRSCLSQQMKTFTLALTVAVIAFVGCSKPEASHTALPAAATVSDLGTVAVSDGGSYDCTLSGGRDCRVCLRALADHRVMVEAVVSRTDAQGNVRILARPHTVAKSGEKVTLEIGEGSVALIPEVKLAAK